MASVAEARERIERLRAEVDPGAIRVLEGLDAHLAGLVERWGLRRGRAGDRRPVTLRARSRSASVRLAYGRVRIIDDVSLELAAGRTTAIVGESGSGKSTLLQMINGLIRPDQGEVLTLGQRVADANRIALRRRIGYAVQGSALFPNLDVETNVTLLARLEGWPPERRRSPARGAARADGSGPRARRPLTPTESSGGQQQRVLLWSRHHAGAAPAAAGRAVLGGGSDHPGRHSRPFPAAGTKRAGDGGDGHPRHPRGGGSGLGPGGARRGPPGGPCRLDPGWCCEHPGADWIARLFEDQLR
ncbi:MAG: ATP-binding cassette domain-containing protein [Gammaproteobacteria bacterium]|nr:ATP-binding cassette domain-containing protein [Gammaproteobacteria bacterium]